MRITQEADYALRIVCLLAKNDTMMDANTILSADCRKSRIKATSIRNRLFSFS